MAGGMFFSERVGMLWFVGLFGVVVVMVVVVVVVVVVIIKGGFVNEQGHVSAVSFDRQSVTRPRVAAVTKDKGW